MPKDKITLEHGAGGTAMMKLISEIVLKEFTLRKRGPVGLDELDDGAAITIGDKTLVFTTDAHTVKPIFFPGGDMGRLAVSGTVNDLAVMGGRPLAMACAVVVEEGFPIDDFRRICKSMDSAAKEVDVAIVTGDLKVMEKGAIDGIVITTTGVGLADSLKTDYLLKPGHKILTTGTIGDHGATILAKREGIDVGEELSSDVAPIWEVVEAAMKAGEVSAMKDPTRGGVAGALNEFASKSKVGVLLEEKKIPVAGPVRSLCEMLGLDPLTLTNEGKVLMGVAPEDSEAVLHAIRKTKYGKNAEIIGEATSERPGKVIMKTSVGGGRILPAPLGDPVPRIC
ncbi:MAG: hydrogenase expression/formation protein HypE [Candidatus Hadarchaeota archaeon]